MSQKFITKCDMETFLVLSILMAIVRVNCSPRYLILAPNKLRYDVDEHISITVTEVRNLSVRVHVRDHQDRMRIFSTAILSISEDLPTMTTVRVPSPSLPENDGMDRKVEVVVESLEQSVQIDESVVIPLTKVSGYIFIQTDKPIYTPDQEVKFRVIPLDEDRLPTSDPVQIDVVNPQGVTIQRWTSAWQRRFISLSFQLPDIPVMGLNWTIKAKFIPEVHRDVQSTTEFEVTEYVLPRFSVQISTGDREIILPTTVNFTIQVMAKFVYGKSVQGEATIKFGVQADGRYEFCPFVFKKTLIGGTATFDVEMTEVATGLQSFWFPDGARLQIEAEVLERTSGRKERCTDRTMVFVQRPFVLSTDESRKYFKPGLPYDLKIKTFWTNKRPASNLPLTVDITKVTRAAQSSQQTVTGITSDADGSVLVPVTSLRSHDHLRFQIRTDHADYERGQQTDVVLEVPVSLSPSGQFLQITARKNGTELDVAVHLTHNVMSKIYILVLGSGSVIGQYVKSLTVGNRVITFKVPLQQKMVPSRRVMAYYVTENPSGPEVVSDSVVISLPGMCSGGELTMTANRAQYFPGDSSGANLHVQGAPNSIVGFAAVDEALLLLNKKGMLDRTLLEKSYRTRSDGCDKGGGRNSRQVFLNSGVLISSNAISAVTMDTSCGSAGSRHKRSIDEYILEKFRTHPCCVAGDLFSRNISDVAQCYDEGKEVYSLTNSSACSKIFYRCCKIYAPNSGDFAKIAQTGIKDYTFSDIDGADHRGVRVRSEFPESWIFEEDYLDLTGNLIKNVKLPHSITRHMIQAVSISPRYGICVAMPISIATYQDFFIDLDLPYSIVRLEQTEVRATVYNYGSQTLEEVQINMRETDGICSSKSKRGFIRVRIPANSAEMVRFPIVPLRAGEYDIEVTARSGRVRDVIRKKILVINEGKEKVKSVSFWLDPYGQKGRTQHQGDINIETTRPVNMIGVQKTSVDLVLPEEAIPGTGKCKVTAVGNIMDTTVRTVIEDVERLLNKLPHGCGEQTMINMAPIVYALRYLVNTGQINDNLLDKGRRMVERGYQKELLFRKTNGSFSTWPHKPSSTWLTAFVLKVFCEAQRYSHVDPMVICTGMEYLLSRQRHDGSFEDEYPVYHKEMLGGNIGRVSRTAFILITLLECDCRPPGTDRKVQRAVRFLENSLDYINQVYPLSITAYALALAYSNKRYEANVKLRTFATDVLYSQSGTEGMRYWTVSGNINSIMADLPTWYRRYPDAIDVEVTSYALLTQMELDEIEYSSNIVEWLLHNRQSSGAFVSTQDTVIALQALAMYNIRTYARDLDLRLTLETSVDRAFRRELSLSQNDVEIEKSVDEIPLNGKLNITTEGSGVARMEVEVRYNVNVSEHEVCKFHIEVFDSDVDLEQLTQYGYSPREFDCDVCGDCTKIDLSQFNNMSEFYNVPQLNPRIRGLDRPSSSSSSSSRIGRSIISSGASKQQICLEICVSYLGYEELDMPVIDIGLPTGFIPHREDFQALVDDDVIDKFEISKRSVTLYLADIPSDKDMCFKFRTVKEFEVENLQAAKIEVFDYYKSDERCVKFYSMKYEIADLDIFCSRNECHCVEGSCAETWDSKLEFRQISRSQLFSRTCREYDYVVRIEVANIMVSGNHLMVSTVVHSSIKPGLGRIRDGDELTLWVNLRCTTPIIEGEFYMIYGKEPIQYVDEQGYKRYRYYLQGGTAMMKDYTRVEYATTASLRYWQRFLVRLERYVKRRMCR